MIYNLFGDVTPRLFDDIKTLVESHPEDHELLINIDSYGGNLSTAFALWDYLRSIPTLKVKTHVQGNCMSAATIIALIAKAEDRSATKHSVFMVHSPLTETVGMQDTETISSLADTMKGALNEIVSIYQERTGMELNDVQTLVNSKREFYASEALRMGFITSIDTLYNQSTNYKQEKKIKDMKESILKALCNRITKALLNEAYQTKDGQELEIGDLAIGGAVAAEDGVYELKDGTVITVENQTIVDIIPAPEEEQTEAPAEELENEGEEAPAEETPAEEVAEEVAEVVEQTIEDEKVTDATEIAEIVKEIVETELAELADLKALVNACGGKDKLKTLANVKHQSKVFNAEQKKENKGTRSIAELVAMKRK